MINRRFFAVPDPTTAVQNVAHGVSKDGHPLDAPTVTMLQCEISPLDLIEARMLTGQPDAVRIAIAGEYILVPARMAREIRTYLDEAIYVAETQRRRHDDQALQYARDKAAREDAKL